ncbi:Conjugative transposon protein TraK [Arcticibacter svalbardensis MN12-7]|uniref:Conjugative transposon protein TraK n=2 Tax=Arcticibacter TaxID=1288026 RepID=R9GWY1_9SPHI|nr:Conjugative transposon protein TraK [Arcticibacter svalbardensis MN12-7]
MVASAQQRIYILANGKAIEAFSADRKDNIPVEARDHISMFHQWFFSLDPDEKVILSNLTKALYLADGSAKAQYDNLRESGYYASLISGNISQEITVDSIRLDMDQYPFFFTCYATQKLIRSSSLLYRSLVTQGYLRHISRSDHNPHGFLIERWSTLENKDLPDRKR